MEAAAGNDEQRWSGWIALDDVTAPRSYNYFGHSLPILLCNLCYTALPLLTILQILAVQALSTEVNFLSSQICLCFRVVQHPHPKHTCQDSPTSDCIHYTGYLPATLTLGISLLVQAAIVLFVSTVG